MPPPQIVLLTCATTLISLGGLLPHARLHPADLSLFNWWATVFGTLNTSVAPVCFLFRKSAGWGWLLTWASLIAGTVGMSYYSLSQYEGPFILSDLIFKSTLPHIVILWAKYPLALAILAEWKKYSPKTLGGAP